MASALDIPVCCACGAVCCRRFLVQRFEARIAPFRVFDTQRRGSQREYWLGVGSLQAVCLPSGAARNFEREELTNPPQRPLCRFWPVFLLLFLPSSQPGRKQLLWNTQPASSAHHLSARWEKQRQIWALFCLQLSCKDSPFGLFCFVHVQLESDSFLTHSLFRSLSPHTGSLKVFTRRTYWSCYRAHFFIPTLHWVNKGIDPVLKHIFKVIW